MARRDQPCKLCKRIRRNINTAPSRNHTLRGNGTGDGVLLAADRTYWMGSGAARGMMPTNRSPPAKLSSNVNRTCAVGAVGAIISVGVRCPPKRPCGATALKFANPAESTLSGGCDAKVKRMSNRCAPGASARNRRKSKPWAVIVPSTRFTPSATVKGVIV